MAAEFTQAATPGGQLFEIAEPVAAPDPHQHLVALVDCSDEPIISKRLDGTIISWNAAATRVFGYLPHEIIGKSILTLIPPDLQHEEHEILRKLRAGERIEHYETTRMRKNGERFPISVTISPIRDASGNVVAASKIAHDISDRR
jgi:PAS domain S-box-containing protein